MRRIDADAFDSILADGEKKARKSRKYVLESAINTIRGNLANVPTSEERKTGEWIYGEDDAGQDGWTCSECGFFVPWYYDYYGLNNIDFIRDFHTCPHCDAKMLTYTGKDGGEA